MKHFTPYAETITIAQNRAKIHDDRSKTADDKPVDHATPIYHPDIAVALGNARINHESTLLYGVDLNDGLGAIAVKMAKTFYSMNPVTIQRGTKHLGYKPTVDAFEDAATRNITDTDRLVIIPNLADLIGEGPREPTRAENFVIDSISRWITDKSYVTPASMVHHPRVIAGLTRASDCEVHPCRGELINLFTMHYVTSPLDTPADRVTPTVQNQALDTAKH